MLNKTLKANDIRHNIEICSYEKLFFQDHYLIINYVKEKMSILYYRDRYVLMLNKIAPSL